MEWKFSSALSNECSTRPAILLLKYDYKPKRLIYVKEKLKLCKYILYKTSLNRLKHKQVYMCTGTFFVKPKFQEKVDAHNLNYL